MISKVTNNRRANETHYVVATHWIVPITSSETSRRSFDVHQCHLLPRETYETNFNSNEIQSLHIYWIWLSFFGMFFFFNKKFFGDVNITYEHVGCLFITISITVCKCVDFVCVSFFNVKKHKTYWFDESHIYLKN